MKIRLILALMVLSFSLFSVVPVSAGNISAGNISAGNISSGDNETAQRPFFDTNGTITKILTPSSIIVNTKQIDLEGIDSSGLNEAFYDYLMQDLNDWFVGKKVFVKGNYLYLDLGHAYNSVSINEMIQNEIRNLLDEQYWEEQYISSRFH